MVKEIVESVRKAVINGVPQSEIEQLMILGLENQTKHINLALASQRGLSIYQVIAIDQVYQKLKQVLVRPDHFGNEQQVVDIVKGFEYTLQSLWGFDLNKDHHRYWNEIEGCLCPQSNNAFRYINGDCRFHGGG